MKRYYESKFGVGAFFNGCLTTGLLVGSRNNSFDYVNPSLARELFILAVAKELLFN